MVGKCKNDKIGSVVAFPCCFVVENLGHTRKTERATGGSQVLRLAAAEELEEDAAAEADVEA